MLPSLFFHSFYYFFRKKQKNEGIVGRDRVGFFPFDSRHVEVIPVYIGAMLARCHTLTCCSGSSNDGDGHGVYEGAHERKDPDDDPPSGFLSYARNRWLVETFEKLFVGLPALTVPLILVDTVASSIGSVLWIRINKGLFEFAFFVSQVVFPLIFTLMIWVLYGFNKLACRVKNGGKKKDIVSPSSNNFSPKDDDHRGELPEEEEGRLETAYEGLPKEYEGTNGEEEIERKGEGVRTLGSSGFGRSNRNGMLYSDFAAIQSLERYYEEKRNKTTKRLMAKTKTRADLMNLINSDIELGGKDSTDDSSEEFEKPNEEAVVEKKIDDRLRLGTPRSKGSFFQREALFCLRVSRSIHESLEHPTRHMSSFGVDHFVGTDRIAHEHDRVLLHIGVQIFLVPNPQRGHYNRRDRGGLSPGHRVRRCQRGLFGRRK